jgi:hypothetical protein
MGLLRLPRHMRHNEHRRKERARLPCTAIPPADARLISATTLFW